MPRLLEYQAKELLRRFAIPVPRGAVVASAPEALMAATRLGYPVAVKAQVKTGGRGKAGGIKFACNAAELEAAACALLGGHLQGFSVEQLLIEQKLPPAGEWYLGVFADPFLRQPVVLFSRSGGMEVEGALATGEGVVRQAVNILTGLTIDAARDIARRAGLSAGETEIVSRVMLQLYELYRQMDCTLAEINPLVLVSGSAWALDAKVGIDDDAVFRHRDLDFLESGEEVGDRPPLALETVAAKIDALDHRGSAHFIQIDPGGERAIAAGMVPIGFDGVGTGASLVTMDELMDLGFAPVNFCDTSGNPTASKLYRATRVILAQTGIKGYVFVSCLSSQQLDNTARGIIKAFKEVFPGGRPSIPCVFAFRGAWDETALGLFRDHGLLDSPLVRVLGRDATERTVARAFAELYREWERGR